MARDQRTRFVFTETDGEHGAFATRALVHVTRTQHDDPRAFLDAEHPGDTRRGDLADAVADGAGASLHRIVVGDFGNDATNWIAASTVSN